MVKGAVALDDTGFPQPTGEFETLAADSVVVGHGKKAARHSNA